MTLKDYYEGKYPKDMVMIAYGYSSNNYSFTVDESGRVIKVTETFSAG